MKRMTLLTYRSNIQKTTATTISRAIKDAYSMRLGWGNGKCCPSVGRVGDRKLLPLHPPELSSPARKPTNASFTHCATRNGRSNCSLVCWRAGPTASIAEIGKQAPRAVCRNWQQGTVNRESGQLIFGLISFKLPSFLSQELWRLAASVWTIGHFDSISRWKYLPGRMRRRGYDAGAIRSVEPAVASEVAHHRKISVGVTRIVALTVRLSLELIDAVFGMGENCQGDRQTLSDQFLEPVGCRGAWRFKIVFTQYPKLLGLDREKRWHWIVAERRAENIGLAFLPQFGLAVRQNKVGVIAVEVLIPSFTA